MEDWKKIVFKHRTISWLLIFSILILVLFPAHLHMHHDQEASSTSTSHKHVIDIHVSTDHADQSHHEDAAVIDTVPNILVKKLNDNSIAPFVFLAIFMLLAAVRQVIRFYRFSNYHPLKNFYHDTPPLRAPPTL